MESQIRIGIEPMPIRNTNANIRLQCMSLGDERGGSGGDRAGEGRPAPVQRHPGGIRQRPDQQERQLIQIWEVHGHQL
jgi:hypothetical protein